MINKIVIIEDEKLNAERLERMIKSLRPNASIVATLESIAESIAWFNNHETPDVLMMDIRLTDGLSFDIFNAVQINCPIIFTTAYDEYAVKAFKHNSIDYLLKPVEKEELAEAFVKVEECLPYFKPHEIMANLLQQIQPKNYRNRFLIPYRDGYKTIFTDEILYIYLDHKIVKAHLADETEIPLNQTMEELELQLDPGNFFRANRQHIIHIRAIQQLTHSFNGKLNVVLKGHDNVIVVSREKAHLLKLWMDY